MTNWKLLSNLVKETSYTKAACLLWKLFSNGTECADMVEKGQAKDRRGRAMSIFQTNFQSTFITLHKPVLDKRAKKELEEVGPKRSTKRSIWRSISFPELSHMAADGPALEDQTSESSCSQGLFSQLGSQGLSATSRKPEINEFYCVCTSPHVQAGWEDRLGKRINTSQSERLYLQIAAEIPY